MEKTIQKLPKGNIVKRCVFSALLATCIGANIYLYSEINKGKEDIAEASHKIEQQSYVIDELQKELHSHLIESDIKFKDISQKMDALEKLNKKYVEENALLQKKMKESINTVSKSTTKSLSQTSLGTFTVSHYTATCKGCSGITSAGINVKNTVYYQGYRIVATDPSVIKTGSILEISYNGKTFKAIALDKGGAIKGKKMDILVGSVSEAYSLGVQKADVKLLRNGF